MVAVHAALSVNLTDSSVALAVPECRIRPAKTGFHSADPVGTMFP
jgi:hypothetical protein